MALDPKNVGRTYGPYRYKLGLEKMKEFAFAIAGGLPSIGWGGPPPGLDPVFYDEEAAKKGPHGAVVAFPTFAATFAIEPFTAAITDPQVGVDLLMMVHGEQDFEFFDVMRDGDVMTTTGTIRRIDEKPSHETLVVETESKNQHGKLVVRGIWTAVIRR
jgi:acyl dehydratase